MLTVPSLPVVLSVPRPVVAAALALATAGVLALTWVGGELHYENCVSTAQAQVGTSDGSTSSSKGSELEKRIDGCSRLPF